MSVENIALRKKTNETELAYIWRIGKLKDDGVIDMTWGELTDVMNKQLRDSDEEWTESAYRKKYSLVRNAYEQIFSNYKEDDYLHELTIQKQEIQKEKRKLFDERLDLNKRLREEARLETTIERLEKSITDIADIYFPTTNKKEDVLFLNGKLIVCLSDLHIGAEFNNIDGRYDVDIAVSRINQYLEEIKGIQEKYKCRECVVAILGDCISGNIHHSISVTNKEDVIEQVKTASILICNFINELSNCFNKVSVYSVGGNHSRIEKRVEDALLSERLDNLIPWFVENMMKNKNNVFVYSNTFDETLGIMNVGEKVYFIQHGDYSQISDASIGKLVLWAKQTPYCVLTGHYHYPAMTDVSGIKVVQSGSLCGSGDEFTRSKRLTGKPSQTVLLTKDDGSIYGVFPIELD